MFVGIAFAPAFPPGWTEAELLELGSAIQSADIKKIDTLLDRKPWLLNCAIGRETLLFSAAFAKDSQVTDHLRKRGAKVDMGAAAKMGWDEDIRAIVRADCQSLTRPAPYSPAIFGAIYSRRYSTVKLMLDLGSPTRFVDARGVDDILRTAVEVKDAEMVRLVLERMRASDLKLSWWSALATACRRSADGDNEAILRMLLDKKSVVSDGNWDGGRLLREACEYGNVPAVRLLLKAGADPNARVVPNQAAVGEALLNLAERVEKLAFEMDPRDPDTRELLFQPNQENVQRFAEFLVLRLLKVVPYFSGCYAYTDYDVGALPPIHMAAVTERIKDVSVRHELADLLTRAGARWTFPAAVALGKTAVVRDMLAGDPTLAKTVVYRFPWAVGCAGFSEIRGVYDLRPYHVRAGLPESSQFASHEREVWALEAAAERGDTDIVRLLLPLEQPKQAEREPVVIQALLAAVAKRDVTTVRTIVEAPSHLAVLKERLGVVYAIEKGFGKVEVLEALTAVRNPTKEEASAAICEAASAGQLAVAQRAATLGGDPGLPDRYGITALYRATERGNVDVVRWLLEQRVDPNRACREGTAAAHIAAEKGHALCLKALLGAKADPNQVGRAGWTPWMLAASNNRPSAVRVLIAGGADLSATMHGDTALHVAVYSGAAEAFAELLRAGADPHAKNNGGETPHDIVMRYLAMFTRADGLKKIKALLEASPGKK
jgi:ankyrin repeat protein